MSVRMDMEGFEEVLQQLLDMPDTMQAGAVRAVNQSILYAHEVAVDLTPVRTGHLRASNQFSQMDSSMGTILFGLFNTAEYAPYVVFGTRYMSANDFMTPAMQAGADMLMSLAPSVLQDAGGE